MAKLQKEVDRLEGNNSIKTLRLKGFSRNRIPERKICSMNFDSSNFVYFFLDELLAEKEKYKGVSEELDMTLNELSGY
jgi:hypothetical protein